MFKRYFVGRALGEKVIESCQRGLERIARGFSSHSFPNLWDKAAKHIISEIGSTPPSPLLVFILADVATRWNCEWWCGFEENEQIAVELYLAYKNNLIGNEVNSVLNQPMSFSFGFQLHYMHNIFIVV